MVSHFLAEQVGWNDLGYHNDLIASPWIDKLALGGVRLTNHHAFKVCAPSRSGFHSGRLPWQMGYYDNSGAATPWISVDDNKLGADTRFKLLPELLALKGYVSHAIGKWHCGCSTRAYTPTYRGYSSFLGYYHAMTEDHWAHTHATGKNCPGECTPCSHLRCGGGPSSSRADSPVQAQDSGGCGATCPITAAPLSACLPTMGRTKARSSATTR